MSAHAASPAPAPAAAASARGAPAAVIDVATATAERIYVALISKSVEFSAGGAKMSVKPEALARLSLTLGRAFHAVEVADRAPVEVTSVKFDSNAFDFDAWDSEKKAAAPT